MKKKFVSTLVCMLMFVAASTVTGTMNDESYETDDFTRSIPQTNAIWDIQFNYDCETITGGAIGIAGAEFDGTYFYVSQWGYTGLKEIFKIDKDGNLVGSFDPSFVSGTGIRDMAWDGQYLYGSNAANAIYCFDGDGNLIETISTSVAVRSIAYDSGNDAFWVNNFDTDLSLVDRDGSVIDTITTPPSMYGSAYDDICTVDGFDGPFLWIFTGTSTGGPCQIEQFDLATKTLTGMGHSVSGDFGSTGIAGGLFFTTEFTEGFATLGGLMQYTPDTLFGYEICVTNFPPETPSTPDGPTEGVVTLDYDFTTSTTDPDEDMVKYGWDYDGDFVVDEWTDFIDSGDTCQVTYSWNEPGTYNIRVKAMDENEQESDWSAPHEIELIETPDLDIISISGGLFKVTSEIINNGPISANDVSWELNLNGGIILLGGTNSGTIDVPAGQTKTIESGIIIGFGSVTINVNLDHPLSSATDSKTAFVLGILIL